MRILFGFVIGLSFLNASCSSTPETVTGPDGTAHRLVRCSNIRFCYSQAMKVCAGTYKIVNTSSDVTSGYLGPSSYTNLLIKCDHP